MRSPPPRRSFVRGFRGVLREATKRFEYAGNMLKEIFDWKVGSDSLQVLRTAADQRAAASLFSDEELPRRSLGSTGSSV